MGSCRVIKKITGTVTKQLGSTAFKVCHRMNRRDFTRNRKLSFPEVCTIIIRNAKSGYNAAIAEALNNIDPDMTYSAAALCKARQKINYTAFRELMELTGEAFYDSVGRIQTKLGFRVWAIDGSKINLPTNSATLEEFGSEPFSNGAVAQALGSCLFDTLNGVTFTAELERFDANERELAVRHIRKLKQYHDEQKSKIKKELIVADRGYPSEELISEIISAGFYFVIRVNKDNFWKEVRDAQDDECVIEHKGMSLRMVRRLLKKAETTAGGKREEKITFLTNLPAKYTGDAVAEFYKLRWKIETNYNYLKNRIELESFTGVSPLCIKQDFYAALMLTNLIAAVQNDVNKTVTKKEARKYEYKLNYAETFRRLSENLYAMLLAKNDYQYNKAYQRLRDRLVNAVVPVRPERNVKRGKPRQGKRFFHNHKTS